MVVLEPITNKTPTGLQRTCGRASVKICAGKRLSEVTHLSQSGSSRLRFPKYQGTDSLQGIVINTAGGLTGGDTVDLTIDVGAGGEAVITTQACEKFYRSFDEPASVVNRLSLGKGARLHWLPQETILYEHAHARRRLDVSMHPEANLVACETLVFGRTSRGEKFDKGQLHESWRVRNIPSNALIHSEALSIDNSSEAERSGPFALGHFRTVSTILATGERAANKLNTIRQLIPNNSSSIGAASVWSVAGTTKLVVRMLSVSSYALRPHLIPILQELCGHASMPRIWST